MNSAKDLEKMVKLLDLTDVPHDDFKEMELYLEFITTN